MPNYFSEVNVTVCDVELQGEEPQVITETERYTAGNGCDSTVTINYLHIPPATIQLDTVLCVGESLFGYSEAGQYVDTLYENGNCATIRTLQLAYRDAGDPQCLVPTIDPAVYDGIRIFPNPARQELTIQFREPADDRLQLRLLDMQGRELLHEKPESRSEIQVDISTLPSGMYLLQLNRGSQNTVHKVIKME